MTDWARILKRAKSAAVRYGRGSDWEDLSQTVALTFLEQAKRGLRGQTIDQATIDAIRAEYGRKDRPTYESFRAVRTPAAELHDNIPAIAEDQETYRALVCELDGTHRIAVILRFEWGMTLDEMTWIFGMSKTRILRLIQEAINECRPRAGVAKRKKQKRIKKGSA